MAFMNKVVPKKTRKVVGMQPHRIVAHKAEVARILASQEAVAATPPTPAPVHVEEPVNFPQPEIH